MPRRRIALKVGELDETVRRRLNEWVASSRKAVTLEAMSNAVGRPGNYAGRYLEGLTQRADLQTLKVWAGMFGKTLNELLDLSADPRENQVLEKWRMLTADQQAALMAILDGLTGGIVRPQDR
jgi:hypothetical protein